MSSSYPSQETITKLFSALATGNAKEFFDHVDTDVDWTVMGTHPCAGRYHSVKDFQQKTFARLGGIMQTPPGMQLVVRNVIGGGEQPWACVELVANAICKNGLKFDNCYAWIVRFNEKGVIVEVRAYLDSWLVGQALVENESQDVKYERAAVPRVEDLK